MDRTRRRTDWIAEFVVLYEATAGCGLEQARFVSSMLYPSLEKLSPSEAVNWLLASEDVPGDIQQRFRDNWAA